MKTINDNKNELIKRRELVLELESDKNPNFEEVKKMLIEKFQNENIDVYGIKGGFGKKTFNIKANIYDSKEDLVNIKNLETTRKQKKESNKKTEQKSEEESQKN